MYAHSGAKPLTLDQVREQCPSAFAEASAETVSDRYAFASTAGVLRNLTQDGWEPVFARERGTRKPEHIGFQQHVIRLRRDDVSEVQLGELVPELVLINSHNATSALQIKAGLFRLVCSNGLMVADSTISPLRIRHAGFDSQDLVRQVSHVADAIPADVGRVRQMQDRKMDRDEREEFARKAMVIRFGDPNNKRTSWPFEAERILYTRRRDDVGEDLWHVFNRVQENVVKGRQRYVKNEPGMLSRRGTTRALTSAASLVDVNLRLWALADNYLDN